MSIGKALRMGKIFRHASKRAVLVPMDHGFTLGPIRGIESIAKVGDWLPEANIDGVILHKGTLERLAIADKVGGKNVILHLNGMNALSPDSDTKEMVTSFETARLFGVDGVSIQTNFDGRNDHHNWKLMGHVADQALANGLPLLAMVYDKVPSTDRKKFVERQRILLRAATELGVDVIKIGIPQYVADLEPILADVSDDVHVLVAGGESTKPHELLNKVRFAITCGAAGVCIGRNVFAADDPHLFIHQVNTAVHGYRREIREVEHANL